jgi:O-antigen/teichoic acid export membrane protein
MPSSFLSNLLLMIFLNLLIKPLAIFGIDASVQNQVGFSNYGTYFSLLNLTLILNILMDLGINNYTTKQIAQNPEIAKRYFGKVFSFRLFLFIIYFLMLLIIGFIIGYSENQMYLLLLLGINQFFIILIAYCRSHFAGFHFFKLDAIISVMDRLLLILVAGVVLLFPKETFKMTVELFIWIQLICYASTLILAFILLRKHIEKPFFEWDIKFSISLLKKSYPYALLIILMIVYTRIDGVMIERMKGPYQAGIYAQGFRLLDALYMFGMIFAGLLYPMFSRNLKKSKESITELLRSSGNLLMSGAILIVFVMIYNGSYLLSLIYNDYQAALPVFNWLMLSFLAICMNFIFGTLLTANGNLKVLNYTSLFGIIVNIFLNLYLIPTRGAEGAAFASFITQSFTATIQFIYCLNLFAIKVNKRLVLNYLALLILLYGFSNTFFDSSYFLLKQISLGVILLLLLSFIRIKDLKELLEKTS